MFRRNKPTPEAGETKADDAVKDIQPVRDVAPTPPIGGAPTAPAPGSEGAGDAPPAQSADRSDPNSQTGRPAMTSSPADNQTGSTSAATPTRPTQPSGPTPTVARPASPTAGITAPPRGDEAAQSAAQLDSPAKPKQVPRQLLVGREIEMSGEISTCDELVVEGRVEAKVASGESLQIAECGEVKGEVNIEQADIAGLFEGDLKVSGRLTVRSTGRVRGTISYGDLAVEAGGKIRGELRDIEDNASEGKGADGPVAVKPAGASAGKTSGTNSGETATSASASTPKQAGSKAQAAAAEADQAEHAAAAAETAAAE